MRVIRFAAVAFSAAAMIGAGFGAAQAATPGQVAPAAVAIDDTTPATPDTGTGSAAMLPTLLQALVSGSAETGTTPTTPTTTG